MRLLSLSTTRSWFSIFSILSLALHAVAGTGIDFDPDNSTSIKAAAKVAAENMVTYYKGDEPGQTPGVMPYPPFYWWLGGAMFQTLIDYWHYTGDSKWNDMVMRGMLHQTGENNDYKPANQSLDLGNDDQAFWAMAAMTAAESNFPNPPKDKPQWLALAQAVFNEQAADWVKRQDTCGGGLMWQLFDYNPGFNYKNSISNGCFFNIAARLAAYTGNKTYAEWAEKTWNWMSDVGLLTKDYTFLDGAYTKGTENCTKKNDLQWSYNAAIFLYGSGMMYKYNKHDHTQQETWKNRTQGVLKGIKEIFFNKEGILAEVACEPVDTCNNDEQSFKAYTTQYMASTVQVANFTADTILPLLRTSAIAAAQQCSGPGNICGLEWTKKGTYDGKEGPGEQMSAVEVFLGNLVKSDPPSPPADNSTGSSVGNPGAGSTSGNSGSSGSQGGQGLTQNNKPITKGDKAGAGILTAFVVLLVLGGTGWVVIA